MTYKDAIEVFGKEHQLIVAVEELSELQKEITKVIRHQENIEHLTEEIADVYIVLEQLELIASIDKAKINKYYNQKIERLKKTIERGKVLK